MTDSIEFLANGLAAAGVDPAAKAIERPAYIPAGDWQRAQRLARAIVMRHLPEGQRRLVELVYTADCDEVVTEAVFDAEQRAGHEGHRARMTNSRAGRRLVRHSGIGTKEQRIGTKEQT